MKQPALLLPFVPAASFALLVFVTAGVSGCRTKPDEKSSSSTASAASTSHVPDTSGIPGPLGDSIRRGQRIVMHTFEELPKNVGNGLHCTSCHLDGGTREGAAPWVGVLAKFPEYRARTGKEDTIEERINDCFERSMNGKAIDPASEDMKSIVAYMDFVSRELPAGTTVPARGIKRIAPKLTPDRAHGAKVYTEKCAACHGADGAGQSPGGAYTFPALWGPRSFNIGAGMARLDTAAAFVRASMPFGMANTSSALTDQEAYDVADYFIHQDRPDFAGKEHDWPRGGKPADARY